MTLLFQNRHPYANVPNILIFKPEIINFYKFRFFGPSPNKNNIIFFIIIICFTNEFSCHMEGRQDMYFLIYIFWIVLFWTHPEIY